MSKQIDIFGKQHGIEVQHYCASCTNLRDNPDGKGYHCISNKSKHSINGQKEVKTTDKACEFYKNLKGK